MDHTHIVPAAEISKYSDRHGSRTVIPELIYFLVKQSCRDATECRIPYGDEVDQTGLDGRVVTETGFSIYVPKGTSYWEIGTGANAQKKATDDFRKRTKELSQAQRKNATFVFVTSRAASAGEWTEPKQTDWIRRRKSRGWGGIRIIDAGVLANWLREFPALGQWMATKIKLTASQTGIDTPREHWRLIEESSSPSLPPGLFLESREGACDALEAVFAGETQRLTLLAETRTEVFDFVAAYLASLGEDKKQQYSNGCLFIREEVAWRSVSTLDKPHVLVADPGLGLDDIRADLQTLATSEGHRVVIPLLGAAYSDTSKIVKLHNPSATDVEQILLAGGFSAPDAKELSAVGGRQLTQLRRKLLDLPHGPDYASALDTQALARAVLIGGWNANSPEDLEMMRALLGKDYGEWIETIRADTLRSDSPLIQADERWKVIARGEGWDALGKLLTDADLARFEEVAVTVLSERDPKFDLPKEERYSAGVVGKVLTHSAELRKGLVEGLALLGARGGALEQCSLDRGRATAAVVVRRLFEDADWDRWATLDAHLPLLAEAAPTEFLDAVEQMLSDLKTSPIHELFAQEGTGGIGGWNYMSGLLWALEGLAWSTEYLLRVAVILADIASIDPGGNWANRPANSLADIFLPWHVQTVAPFERRKAAIKAVMREHPDVGWKLLLSLLPSSRGFTSGSHKPAWREFVPADWTDSIKKSEYWAQITVITELALEMAPDQEGGLVDLIGRFSDLPGPAQQALLAHLSSSSLTDAIESARLPIWEKLGEVIRRHSKHSNAFWALSDNAIAQLVEVRELLGPDSPELKYRHLFIDNETALYDEAGDWDEQRDRLKQSRLSAVDELLAVGGIDLCLRFATTVASPHQLGLALGSSTNRELDQQLLPDLLGSQDEVVKRVVAGFVLGRYWDQQAQWLDSVIGERWSTEQLAEFFKTLPFNPDVWERVSEHLGDEHEALYWRETPVNHYGRDRDFSVAIEKLLAYDRPGAAVMCISSVARGEEGLDVQLATDALLAVLNGTEGVKELDVYETVQLIGRLQSSGDADENALFQIEWNLLPWLDQFSEGSPVTLERKLATDPAFFADLIALVYRSRHEDSDDQEEPDERKRNLANTAYSLLSEWKRCPGTHEGDEFDAAEFQRWVTDARKITENTGHTEVAQIHIGHVLVNAPEDPEGLWIHASVSDALNGRDAEKMRTGFTTQLFNDRGVHGYTHGDAERALAKANREKALALEERGFTRFAAAMRDFAERYERQAVREANRNPFED